MDYFTIRIRGDTKSNWEFYNPILADREVAMEKEPTGKMLFKIGDGNTEWNSLPYVPYVTEWDALKGRSIGDIVPSFRSLSNPPFYCLPAIGAELNRVDYPELYNIMVENQDVGEDWITLYGGTPGLTFGTPDLRRQFLRGSGAGFNVGSTQVDAFKKHDHGGGVHSHTHTISSEGSHSHGLVTYGAGSHSHTGYTSTNGHHNHSATYGWGHTKCGFAVGVGTECQANYIDIQGPVTVHGAGNHNHTVYTYGVGNHSHSGYTNSTSAHSHSLNINNSNKIINEEGDNETRPENTTINYFFVYR